MVGYVDGCLWLCFGAFRFLLLGRHVKAMWLAVVAAALLRGFSLWAKHVAAPGLLGRLLAFRAGYVADYVDGCLRLCFGAFRFLSVVKLFCRFRAFWPAFWLLGSAMWLVIVAAALLFSLSFSAPFSSPISGVSLTRDPLQ